MNRSAAALIALEALVAPPGVVSLRAGGREIATVRPGVYLSGWNHKGPGSGTETAPGRYAGTIRTEAGDIAMTCTVSGGGRSLTLVWDLAPATTLAIESVQASVDLPAADWAGVRWSVGEKHGEVPGAFAGVVHLFSGPATRLTLGPSPARGGLTLDIRGATGQDLLLQDSRQWGPNLEVRAGHLGAGAWPAGEHRHLALTLACNRPLTLVHDRPVVLAAGPDWIPLAPAGELQPGSALDWSDQGWSRSPAGSRGRIVTCRNRPAAFALDTEPGVPVRFYGVNLCFSALFPTHAEADRLATRLSRLGYNAVRIHHYESCAWADPPGILDPKADDSLTFHREGLDRLDYLMAALERRGIYLTTDLYVNRDVRAAEIFPGATGRTGYRLKHLIHVSDRALANWKAFSRRLLAHINPYTGLSWGTDPALAWISLLNEDNLPNDPGDLRADPQEAALWDAAFARWKAATGRAGAWEDGDLRARFLWETQRRTEHEMTRFLREDLKVKALLTDLNGWSNQYGTQPCRAGLDYVDDHFYWDHPRFLEKDWELPAGMSNGGSAIGDFGGFLHLAESRLLDRPFTVTEANYCWPNHARGEGGLLLGAFAALQDWAGVWRFAYAHGSGDLEGSGPADFFNMATDPLRQLSEYAAIALFRRGDAASAGAEIAITGREEDWWAAPGRALGGAVTRAAWCARLGTLVAEPEMAVNRVAMSLDEAHGAEGLVSALRGLRMGRALPPANITDPARGVFEGQPGETRIDGPAGVFTVATPRTAGLTGPAGTAGAAGPLGVRLAGSGAAVWVSSLDGSPLRSSRRLLLVHLTDLQNSGSRFRGADLTVIEAAGRAPWLVRAGTASIRLAHDAPESLAVWRLGLDGARLAPVAVRVAHGALVFEASTGGTPDRATLAYEVAAR